MTRTSYPTDFAELQALAEQLNAYGDGQSGGLRKRPDKAFWQITRRIIVLTIKLFLNVQRGGKLIGAEMSFWMCAMAYTLRAIVVLLAMLAAVMLMIVPLLIVEWQAGLAALFVAMGLGLGILLLLLLWLLGSSHFTGRGNRRQSLAIRLASGAIDMTSRLNHHA